MCSVTQMINQTERKHFHNNVYICEQNYDKEGSEFGWTGKCSGLLKV